MSGGKHRKRFTRQSLKRLLVSRANQRTQVIDSELARCRLTFEQAAVGLCHLGLDGYWLLANHKFSALVGYTEQELRENTYLEILHSADRDAVALLMQRLVSGEMKSGALEIQCMNKVGRSAWVNWTMTLEPSVAGNPAFFIVTIEDISHRRETEQKLREREVLWWGLFHTLPVGVVLIDPHHASFVQFNDAAALNLGYTREEFAHLSIEQIDCTLNREQIFEVIHNLSGNDFPASFERQHRTKTGEVRDVLVTYRLVEQQGYPLICASWFDITERKRSEEQLRTWNQRLGEEVAERTLCLEALNLVLKKEIAERCLAESCLRDSEQRYKNIVETASEGIWLLDQKECTTFVNAHLAQMLGWPEAYMLGRPLSDFMDAAGYARTQVYLKRSRSGNRELHEWRFQRQDGSTLWALISTTPLFDSDGNFAGTMGMLTDITERKAEEELLRQSEERFHGAFQAAAVGMALIDAEGKYLLVNDALCQLIGYTRAELLTMDFKRITHPDDLQTNLEQAEQLLAGECRSYQIEKRYLHKNGQAIWVHLSASIVRDVHDAPLYRVVQIQDIDARKRAEQALRQSLVEKELLLREIHHRVKNNLQIIVSILSMQGRQLHEFQAQTALNDCRDRIQTMALVHEHLYCSASPGQVNLAMYLTKLAVGLTATYGAPSHIRLRQQLTPVDVDLDVAVPIGLLANELLSNAFKHAFPEPHSGEILLQLQLLAQGKALLVVADNGVGLAPQRPVKSTRSLGLRLVNALARQLHATMQTHFESGTRFELVFPLSEIQNDASA